MSTLKHFCLNNEVDISKSVISKNGLLGKLNSFFTNSLILRLDFIIEAIGSDLEEPMQMRTSEMAGKPFESLCLDMDSRAKITDLLRAGYFGSIPVHLVTKAGVPLNVLLSGFYLGMISDLNGFIILKVKIIEDNSFLKKELVTTKSELDHFIYRSAHDLRGPLATIKGLVNLLKMRQDNTEVDDLTSLIDVHANRLDDRLFKLYYLANTDIPVDHEGTIDLEFIKSNLEVVVKDNFGPKSVQLTFNFPSDAVKGVNEQRVYQLLEHIFLYVISLPIPPHHNSTDSRLCTEINVRNNCLMITVRADGFVAGEGIRHAIQATTSIYNNCLKFPLLFNYYIAQKEAMQLHALLRVDFSGDRLQTVQISIPLAVSTESKSFQDIKSGRHTWMKKSGSKKISHE